MRDAGGAGGHRDDAAARERFWADPRDTATPDAFAALLAQLQRGEGINSASRALLLDFMRRSPTGLKRIRAGVPPGTEVADKTGTVGRTTNDVALVTMPDGSSAYTRGGSLKVNKDGLLATQAGHPLRPAISIPDNAQSVVMEQDGRVLVKLAGQTMAANMVEGCALEGVTAFTEKRKPNWTR